MIEGKEAREDTMKPGRNRTMREPGSQPGVPNQVPILHQSDLQQDPQ